MRFGTVLGPGDRRGTMHRRTSGKYDATALWMSASRLGKVMEGESTRCIPRISAGPRVGRRMDGAWGAYKSMTECVNVCGGLFGWLTRLVGEFWGLATWGCVPKGQSWPFSVLTTFTSFSERIRRPSRCDVFKASTRWLVESYRPPNCADGLSKRPGIRPYCAASIRSQPQPLGTVDGKCEDCYCSVGDGRVHARRTAHSMA